MSGVVKFIDTSKVSEWNNYVNILKGSIYFTAEYHKLYEVYYSNEINKNFGGKAFLFVYTEEGNIAIIPFMKRRIELPYIKEELYDAASVYGYTGPLVNKLENEFISRFYLTLKSNLSKEKIITFFIRCHPLLENHTVLDNCTKLNKVVYVDANKTSEELLISMDKKTRNIVRKAQKLGISIIESNDINQLYLMYTNTMLNNNAHKKYLFTIKYFENLKKLLGDKIKILYAKKNDKILCGAVFLKNKDIIYYHLSGTTDEGRKLGANSLLLYHSFLLAKREGCSTIFLGGGTTTEENDSLFRFKLGFSPANTKYFFVNKLVIDEQRYTEINRQRDNYFNSQGNNEYFPYYRT